MPARWTRMYFGELPPPVLAKVPQGPTHQPPPACSQLPTKFVVLQWRHFCVTDTWLWGEHPPPGVAWGCPLQTLMAVAPPGAETELTHPHNLWLQVDNRVCDSNPLSRSHHDNPVIIRFTR